MKRQVLAIIGSGGRLGKALCRRYRSEFDPVEFPRDQLDLGDLDKLRSVLDPLEFDLMINCAALTAVDYCETHREEAMRINGEAVGVLAEICAAKNVRLVHISTDYVFDGGKEGPYLETDEVQPISVYGESKRAGELALLEASPKHLAVRVSWVFGPDRPSFIDGLIKRAMEHDSVEAVGDKLSTPLYTEDAADLLLPLLFNDHTSGIIHLCNQGSCTWQEYGQAGLDAASAAGLQLKAREVKPVLLKDLRAFVAARPVNSVMSTERLEALTGIKPRPWKEAVEQYVRDHVVPSLS